MAKKSSPRQTRKSPPVPKRGNAARASSGPTPRAEPRPTSPPEVSAPDTDTLVLNALEAGLELPPLDDVPAPRRVDLLHTTYVAALERLSTRAAEIDRRILDHDANHQRLTVETDRLHRLREELQTLRADLNAREEELLTRELDADAGFAARHEAALAPLRTAHDHLTHERAALAANLADDLARHTHRVDESFGRLAGQRDQLLADHDARLQAQLDTLQHREEQLRQREREAQNAERSARWVLADVEEREAHVEAYLRERTSYATADLRAELQRASDRVDQLRARNDELERTIERLRDDLLRFGHQDPEAIQRQLTEQRRHIDALSDELRNRPTPEEAADLTRLRDEHLAWTREREQLLLERTRLQGQLQRLQIDVLTVENLRDRNTALEASAENLRRALDQVRADFELALGQRDEQPIFPQLLAMDADAELQHPPTPHNPKQRLELAAFASDLRSRIADNPATPRATSLYYTERDVRAFLGGLAMSRLHLLQGISGIGKSSLPRAFADAVGGACLTVPVQAGWKDRHDLFGHYNSFDRRYFEAAFTQALYRAATPAFANRLVVVLLDEMNLSHPEQYAADLLDVLARERDRHFELLSFTPDLSAAPRHLLHGRFLPLPPNVWFVGTANHDETTRDFADKTYDRSFVLELPDLPSPFKPGAVPPREPIAVEDLQRAFNQAARSKDGAEAARKALDWMNQHLRATLASHFRLAWGGRLGAQLEHFVPVVVASGGTVAEAVDQAVTTRVLRRLRGRHDNLPEDLRALHAAIHAGWRELPGAAQLPFADSHAHTLLAHELHRMGESL